MKKYLVVFFIVIALFIIGCGIPDLPGPIGIPGL